MIFWLILESSNTVVVATVAAVFVDFLGAAAVVVANCSCCYEPLVVVVVSEASLCSFRSCRFSLSVKLRISLLLPHKCKGRRREREKREGERGIKMDTKIILCK